MALVILSLPEESVPPLGNPSGGSVRIYVELVDEGGKRYPIGAIKKVVENRFAGATITRSEGLWKKKWNPAVIVTVINRPPVPWKLFLSRVKGLEADLLDALNQEEIMVEEFPPER